MIANEPEVEVPNEHVPNEHVANERPNANEPNEQLQPPRRKRTLPKRRKTSGISHRRKNTKYTAQDHANYAAAIANNPALDGEEMEVDDPPPANPVPRADDNWRETRAVASRDNMLQKKEQKIKELEKKNAQEKEKRVKAEQEASAQKKKAATATKKMKEVQKEAVRDKKVSRDLIEEGKVEALDMMEKAQQMMDEAMAEALATLEEKLKNEEACDMRIEKIRAKSDARLAAERGGSAAIIQYMKEKHEKEMKTMQQKLNDKDEEIVRERERVTACMQMKIDNVKDQLMKVEERSDVIKDKLESQLEREKEKTHEVSIICPLYL